MQTCKERPFLKGPHFVLAFCLSAIFASSLQGILLKTGFQWEGGILPPRGYLHCLETLLVVTTGGCY